MSYRWGPYKPRTGYTGQCMNMHRPSVGLKSDWTDDGIPGGRYATGHCPVIVYVRWTRDGTLARGVVQATGQTMRHILKEKKSSKFLVSESSSGAD